MFPLIALITDDGGREFAVHYTVSGSATGVPGPHPMDLVPAEVIEFRNVYPNGVLGDTPYVPELSHDYPTLEAALEGRVEESVGQFTLRLVKVDGKVVRSEVVSG